MHICEGIITGGIHHRMNPPPFLTDSFFSVMGPILLGINISMLVLCTFRDQHFEVPLALTFAQRSRKP